MCSLLVGCVIYADYVCVALVTVGLLVWGGVYLFGRCSACFA